MKSETGDVRVRVRRSDHETFRSAKSSHPQITTLHHVPTSLIVASPDTILSAHNRSLSLWDPVARRRGEICASVAIP